MAEKNYYCKACRGELEIIDNERGRCLYCGEVQPIPQSYEDEFNRANLLRIENKAFDEAEKIYRKIVENNPNDAEAHWGLVLCKYGIEYVDDNNGKKLPTCHRTLTTSILNDIDYKMALEHSSVVSRDYYERNAKLIDDYQIKISRIAKNEEDYDVFISFKARDDYGIPTQDSTYGHKFYNYLTKTLKLKVFFSDVTLKNRSGEEFEPIIYSALRSARAMILICGSYENINAPWVRNEWSRYISWLPEFNDKGIKKLMFTAIIDPMTPEKLPTDLQRFQCSKMSDLGAFEGICKHIADLIGKKRDNNKAGVNMTNGYSGQDITTKMLNEKAANLAKLGMQELKRGDNNRARTFFDDALTNNINCSKAYWGKLMLDYSVKDESMLGQQVDDISNQEYYKLAYRNADAGERELYESVAAQCRKNVEDKKRKDKLESIRANYKNRIKSIVSAFEKFNCESSSLTMQVSRDNVKTVAEKRTVIEDANSNIDLLKMRKYLGFKVLIVACTYGLYSAATVYNFCYGLMGVLSILAFTEAVYFGYKAGYSFDFSVFQGVIGSLVGLFVMSLILAGIELYDNIGNIIIIIMIIAIIRFLIMLIRELIKINGIMKYKKKKNDAIEDIRGLEPALTECMHNEIDKLNSYFEETYGDDISCYKNDYGDVRLQNAIKSETTV